MQEKHSIKNSSKSRGGERHGTDDEVKLPRPSDKMVAALEAEGLHIVWPEYIYVPIKGTFTTESGSEQTVMIDFSYMKDSVKTIADVDKHIARCLYEALMEYNWIYELKEDTFDELIRNDKLYWREVIRVLYDCIQTERRLSRFDWVASCVLDGEPIPPKEQRQGSCETVHITPMMAGEIRECLIKAYPNVKDSPCAKNIADIIDELAWKLDVNEDFNIETGKSEIRKKEKFRMFYKPMPQLHL